MVSSIRRASAHDVHGKYPIYTSAMSQLGCVCLPVLVCAAIDTNANGTVERTEFADFIFHLAVADLKSTQAASLSELED